MFPFGCPPLILTHQEELRQEPLLVWAGRVCSLVGAVFITVGRTSCHLWLLWRGKSLSWYSLDMKGKKLSVSLSLQRFLHLVALLRDAWTNRFIFCSGDQVCQLDPAVSCSSEEVKILRRIPWRQASKEDMPPLSNMAGACLKGLVLYINNGPPFLTESPPLILVVCVNFGCLVCIHSNIYLPPPLQRFVL